jgi:hypothetical protein
MTSIKSMVAVGVAAVMILGGALAATSTADAATHRHAMAHRTHALHTHKHAKVSLKSGRKLHSKRHSHVALHNKHVARKSLSKKATV